MSTTARSALPAVRNRYRRVGLPTVSPFPETRRQMIDRGPTFGTPGYRWIPARATVEVEYWAMLKTADSIPEQLDWPG